MTTTRHCRAPKCPNPAAARRTLCYPHNYRWRHYRDLNYSPWTTADPADIEHAAAARRLLPGMTRLERRLLGLKLTDLGLPAAEIARITGVAHRTVTRWRSTRTNTTSIAAA